MVTEFVKEIIEYMKENLQYEAVASIGFLAIAFLLFFAIVLLIFRKTRLWYWKTEEQVKTLKEMDLTLTEIKLGVENVNKAMEILSVAKGNIGLENLSDAEENLETSDGPETATEVHSDRDVPDYIYFSEAKEVVKRDFSCGGEIEAFIEMDEPEDKKFMEAMPIEETSAENYEEETPMEEPKIERPKVRALPTEEFPASESFAKTHIPLDRIPIKRACNEGKSGRIYDDEYLREIIQY